MHGTPGKGTEICTEGKGSEMKEYKKNQAPSEKKQYGKKYGNRLCKKRKYLKKVKNILK